MKVLLISQYYPPEGVAIPQSVAHYLSNSGHDVRVITGFPNYPSGDLYPGYKQRWRMHEEDGPVDVLRVPLWADHSKSAVRRILNYSTFSLSSSTAYGFSRGADVIYVYATQMTAAFAPWVWSLVGGAPYVLHVQDLWPDSITGSSMVRRGVASKAVTRVLLPWLDSVYRRSAAVIGIAPTMVKTLRERVRIDGGSHLVYNWSEGGSRGRTRASNGCASAREGVINVLYAGNIGDMQDIDSVVHAAHNARDCGVILTLVGDGVRLKHVQSLVADLGCTNINIHGRVPIERMDTFYNQADFTLVTLKDLAVFKGTIPSKFQTSLAQGLPVITTVRGDVRGLVEEFELGFTADPESPSSLEDALRRAAATSPAERQQMSLQARHTYLERFSRAKGLGAIEEILKAASQ